MNIVEGNAPKDAPIQAFNDVLMIFKGFHFNAPEGTTVLFLNNNILRNINKTAGKIPGIRCFKSRISQPLTSTVGRNKVVKYRQALFKGGKNRVFKHLISLLHRAFWWLGHQRTHTPKLTNLYLRTTSSRIHNHIDRIKSYAFFC